MKWINLIGNEQFNLNTIKSIEHYDSIKRYDVPEIKNRYCVDYGERGHIFYDYADIMSDYEEDELRKIPFDKPHFIMMVYTSSELIKAILTQNNFLREIYVDDTYGQILPIDKFIELI
jgi:hypothetical protein